MSDDGQQEEFWRSCHVHGWQKVRLAQFQDPCWQCPACAEEGEHNRFLHACATCDA